MASVTHVFTVDYVAQMLGEHPNLIQAIISNDDNLPYGTIIAVCTGQEDAIDALTPDGLDELASMIKCARLTPERWQQFLDDFVADPEIIKSVKPFKLR